MAGEPSAANVFCLLTVTGEALAWVTPVLLAAVVAGGGGGGESMLLVSGSASGGGGGGRGEPSSSSILSSSVGELSEGLSESLGTGEEDEEITAADDAAVIPLIAGDVRAGNPLSPVVDVVVVIPKVVAVAAMTVPEAVVTIAVDSVVRLLAIWIPSTLGEVASML